MRDDGEFDRYAVYFCPGGDLGEAGAEWLGWDSLAGVASGPVGLNGQALPRRWEELIRRPRKYGFHATIKPPFRLAEGETPDALATGFETFCSTRIAPVEVGVPALARVGSFLALVASGDPGGINRLAAEAVRELDRFRAPPREDELERRRRARLTPSQEANLARWGYPHVMEDFRFHMTLTGPLRHGEDGAVARVLGGRFAAFLKVPLVIGGLCLMGEAPNGRFHVIRRAVLGGVG